MGVLGMMTEAEAKTKWCPLARVLAAQKLPNGDTLHIAGHSSFNRLAMMSANKGSTFETVLPQTTTCIASTCMAWRWKMRAKPYPDNNNFERTSEGFCGAFGPMP